VATQAVAGGGSRPGHSGPALATVLRVEGSRCSRLTTCRGGRVSWRPS